MKKLVALTLLLVLFLSAVRPYFPYLDYAINKEFIAKVLCDNIEKPKLKCNGKCHLKTQLNLASTTTGSSDAILLISESFYPVYFQEKADFFLIDFIQYSHSKIDIAYSNLYHFNFISKALKPPIS